MEIVKEETTEIQPVKTSDDIQPTEIVTTKINLILGLVIGRYCCLAQSQIDNQKLTISTDHLISVLEVLANIRKYEGQYMIYISNEGTDGSAYFQLVRDYLKQYEMPYKEIGKMVMLSSENLKALTGLEKGLSTNERKAINLVIGKRG